AKTSTRPRASSTRLSTARAISSGRGRTAAWRCLGWGWRGSAWRPCRSRLSGWSTGSGSAVATRCSPAIRCAELPPHRAQRQKAATGPRVGSPDDATAHDADLVARDVGGSVGGQEQAGVSDLLRPAETAERDLLELLRGARRRLAELRIPLGVAPLGVHGAGDHDVRADAEEAQLGGQRAHEAEQARLRRGHRGRVGPPGEARLPADGDDAAAPALLHPRYDRARQVEGRVEIDADHAVPVLERCLV